MHDKFCLFCILRNRWNSDFRKKTVMDFLAHISSERIQEALLFSICIAITGTSMFIGLSAAQTVSLILLVYFVFSGIVAAIDTYYKRMQRIQLRAKDSIEVILDLTKKRRFW